MKKNWLYFQWVLCSLFRNNFFAGHGSVDCSYFLLMCCVSYFILSYLCLHYPFNFTYYLPLPLWPLAYPSKVLYFRLVLVLSFLLQSLLSPSMLCYIVYNVLIVTKLIRWLVCSIRIFILKRLFTETVDDRGLSLCWCY